jgi:hypothetical protein
VAGGRGVDGQPDHRPASRNKAPEEPAQPPPGAGLDVRSPRRTAVAGGQCGVGCQRSARGTQGDWGRRSGQVVCGRGIRLRGYPGWMEADVVVRSVERVRTRSGKVRYVVRDADGREFSTFRERIGEEAERYQGQRVHIEFHEEERAGFHNVYLDRIQPIAGGDAADTDPEEAAWRTAVEATPWLVGSGEPEREVPPEELFERLKPFKDRVADDIRSDQE